MPRDPNKLSQAEAQRVASQCPCFHVRQAARAITQLFDDKLRPLGLRATQFTLLNALRLLEPVPVQELAQRLVMDRTTLTRNLRPLEKGDLIRIETGRDRRRREISLSDAGHLALSEAFPLWLEVQRQLADSLGEQTMANLLADLGKATEITRSN